MVSTINDNFSFFESSLTLLITEQREFEYNMIQLSEGLVSNAVIFANRD